MCLLLSAEDNTEQKASRFLFFSFVVSSIGGVIQQKKRIVHLGEGREWNPIRCASMWKCFGVSVKVGRKRKREEKSWWKGEERKKGSIDGVCVCVCARVKRSDFDAIERFRLRYIKKK